MIEIVESLGEFHIINGPETIFKSKLGTEIKKYIDEHEGTYYIRSIKWQDDLVNVKEPS